MSTETKPQVDEQQKETFVETSLKLAGKSAEEAQTTGKLDAADEQVEETFLAKYRTENSPIHLAVWDKELPVELFSAPEASATPELQKVMDDSYEICKRRREDGTMLDENGKVTPDFLAELGGAGYWGTLVPKEYGGQGMPFSVFGPFLTRMSTIQPTVSGLASVHGCIGAVDPIVTFGNEEQKKEYLPKLASGERLSGFALTEPCAGSDLTNLKVEAKLDGDDYVVNGDKLYITNAICGRTVGLVCLIDGKPAALICDLPEEENENFEIIRYGLYALKESFNNGLRFRNFRVPAKNLLAPGKGDGLTVAYHGLNRGRVALCAGAAGTMRLMMASMLPWAKYRRTYGQAIEKRELVRRRLGRMCAMMTGSDALVAWCGWLLDEGYRGEMECTIAKIFGSECQKEGAIELLMKTHGGRSFNHGHIFGDYVHEFLAPCIYEGEGEMLGMGFLKSLIKQHGKQFFEPIGMTLYSKGIKKFNPSNPAHLWALKGPMGAYAKWMLSEKISPPNRAQVPNIPEKLKAHAEYASDALQKSRLEISNVMTTHQLALPDRQCRMAEISRRAQNMVICLVTALYGAKKDEVTQMAADVLCQDLIRERTGKRPSDKYFRTVCKLGEIIADGGFQGVAGVPAPEILFQYDKT